jgi:hypothetical protein
MSRATENLEKMISEMPLHKGPRMRFATLCGAFYALHRGFSRTLVAKAFGISVASASLLSHCDRAGSRHYRRIAEEFHRLGEKEFGETYYTPEIDDRIARFRMGVPDTSDIRTRLADDKAHKYEGRHRIMNYLNDIIDIDIAYRAAGDDLATDYDTGEQTRPLPAGWAWMGAEGKWSEIRWRTSSECFDGAHEGNGVASPRKMRK